jgi:hypothetical protein
MVAVSPLDSKALVAIAFLAGRREAWSVTTYGDLARRIGHAPQGLGDVLNRVGAWCYTKGKRSLALLVIRESDGKPSEGLFQTWYPDAATQDNYEKQRLELWQQSWSEVVLPTNPEEIANAYHEVRPES